jgi:hypothetical protein
MAVVNLKLAFLIFNFLKRRREDKKYSDENYRKHSQNLMFS